MKKIMTAALASATIFTAVASAEIYVGVDMVAGDSMTYTRNISSLSYSDTIDTTESGFRLKIGSGELDKWTWQVYYSAIESDTNYLTSKSLTEFGFDLRPGWELTNNLYIGVPFGLTYGTTEASSAYNSSTWARIGYKVGAEISYVVADQIELLVGYDVKGVSFQDITSGSNTLSITGVSSGIYLGVNYWFGNPTQKAAPYEMAE